MPTVEARIKNAIKAAFDEQANSANNADTPTVSADKIAEAIAKAVVKEITSATILVTGTAGPYPFTQTNITIT